MIAGYGTGSAAFPAIVADSFIAREFDLPCNLASQAKTTVKQFGTRRATQIAGKRDCFPRITRESPRIIGLSIFYYDKAAQKAFALADLHYKMAEEA